MRRRSRFVALAIAALCAHGCGSRPTVRHDWPAWLSAAPKTTTSAYPPRIYAPDAATCERRVATLHAHHPTWRVTTDALCLAVVAERDAGVGNARLDAGEVEEQRAVLLDAPELFGLPFGAPPVEDISELGDDWTLVTWSQDLSGTSALLVSAHARASADHVTTPAGEHPAQVPRRLSIEGHFVPVVLPATPPRRSIPELLAAFDGRPLDAVWSQRGPCASEIGGSSYGGRLIERLDVRGTINAYRGVLAIVHLGTASNDPSWIELRDVVHFLPVGTFHTDGGDRATFRCATTRERASGPGSAYRESVPFGFLVDARTGEDLTDAAPPWTYSGFFGMDAYRPPELTNDGFFTSTLPWPTFELPASSPPA